MTKQKVVLKLDMFDEKRRSKALKTSVSAAGVNSVALDKGDKTKLVVIGEDMDAFKLVKSLRKNFRTELISLEEVEEKKDEEKKKSDEPKPVESWPLAYHPFVPQHIVHTVPVYNPDPCSMIVTSVALDSEDKTKLVVIGEGEGEDKDAFELVKSLRRNFRTKLISLEEVKDKRDEEKKKDDEHKPMESWPFVYRACSII